MRWLHPAAARGPETSDAALQHVSSDAGGAASTGNRATFDPLLADVRRSHVFALQTEKKLGRRREEELPEVALEFARADTRAKLSVALVRAAWHATSRTGSRSLDLARGGDRRRDRLDYESEGCAGLPARPPLDAEW